MVKGKSFKTPRSWKRKNPKALGPLSADARAAERSTKAWRTKNFSSR